MNPLNQDTLTQAVIDRLAHTPNPRLKEILSSLVTHLHAFARDVRLTEEEWFQGIEFLTATGQKCTSTRQEFILLSDVLGLAVEQHFDVGVAPARDLLLLHAELVLKRRERLVAALDVDPG